MISAGQQAGLYYLRRRNRSQQFIAQATEWSSGLTVEAGDVVQANSMAWTAQNSGTTGGSVAPNNADGAAFTDGGGIVWVHTPLLLVAPTPIT